MGKAFKVVRVVGESDGSIEDAVGVALSTSGERVRGHSCAEVKEIRANLRGDGSVERWQAGVDVAFELEGAKA